MNDLSVLKLFKGYIGEKSDQIRKEGLKYGLLISDSASDEVLPKPSSSMAKMVKNGISPSINPGTR